MPANRLLKHNSMFMKLFLSLTAIALITVILIATLTYSISADNSVQNAIAYNESILTQQQELIHKELTAIQYTTYGMITTQSYLYHTKNGKLSVSSLIDLTSFVEAQQKISPYIDSIYLYYAPLELVLTSRTEIKTSPISTFSDLSWLDAWKQPSATSTLWITGRGNSFLPDQPTASLLQKIPLVGKVTGAIVINLKLELLLQDYLSHYHNKKGATLVLGPNSELLYSDAPPDTAATLLQQLEPERLIGERGYYMDESNRIVSFTASEKLTGWRFVDITERSELLKGMGRIKFMVILVAAAYLLAASATSFFLSRRLYRPLQRVITYIGSSTAGQRGGSSSTQPAGDEAGFIRHIFDQFTRNWEILQKENRHVNSLLADNRTAIKEKYLNDLVQGGGIDQAAEQLGLQLNFDRFAVLIFEIEEPYPVKGLADGILQFHLFRYGLMEELGADIDGELFAKDDKKTVILLRVPPDQEDFPLEQAKRLKQLLQTRYAMNVTIAVSRTYRSGETVRSAYAETQETLNLKMYIGKGEILSSDMLGDWKSSAETYYYPYELETKLLQALLQTDQGECFAVIRQITRKIIVKKLGKTNIQQLFFQLSGEIMKTLVQTRGDMAAVFGDRPAYADVLACAETLPDMEACLLDICGRIITYHKEKRSKMSDVTLTLATDYMDANFNKNISVDTVADYVQRSSSYLSRVFKESTGMTVNDYLIQLRLKRAMELLKQDTAIEEICREIGYANVSYFNKIFKARTGITPGQYRQQQAAERLLAQAKNQAE